MIILGWLSKYVFQKTLSKNLSRRHNTWYFLGFKLTIEFEFGSRTDFLERKGVTLTMTLKCKVKILHNFTKIISFLVNLRKSELLHFHKRWYCFRFDQVTTVYCTDHPFTYIILSACRIYNRQIDRSVHGDFGNICFSHRDLIVAKSSR